MLVAHNAHGFDMRFIRKGVCGASTVSAGIGNTYIDTLPHGVRRCIPGLRNYKLDTIGKHLEIPPFQPPPRRSTTRWRWPSIFVKVIADLALRGKGHPRR